MVVLLERCGEEARENDAENDGNGEVCIKDAL